MNTDHWAVGEDADVNVDGDRVTGVIQAVDDSTEPSRVRVRLDSGVKEVDGTQVSLRGRVA